MKKQILEAIQKGLQKSLSFQIDSDESDFSIKKTNVNSTNSLDIAINSCIESILNDEDVENNVNTLCQYVEKGLKYKVSDFNEFSQIFAKVSAYDDFAFECLDLSNVADVILEGNTEIPLDKFNQYSHNAKFIKLKNSICGHDIILHEDTVFEQMSYQYYSKTLFDERNCITDETNALHDYNGFEHTYENVNYDTANPYKLYALNHCVKSNKIGESYGLTCYMPALGELKFIYDNSAVICFMLRYIGSQSAIHFYNDLRENVWASSTEYNDLFLWYIYRKFTGISKKENTYSILRLFKQNERIS